MHFDEDALGSVRFGCENNSILICDVVLCGTYLPVFENKLYLQRQAVSLLIFSSKKTEI
jgi:hypothetical protein